MHDCCPKKHNIFVWMLEAVPGIFTHFQEIWFLLFFIFLRQRLDSFFLIFVFFSLVVFFFFLLFVKWYIICSEVLLLWLPCNVPGIPFSTTGSGAIRLIYIYIFCSPGIHYWYRSRYMWLLFIIYVYSTPSAVRGNEHYRSPQTVRCSCYLLTIDIIITIMFTFVLVYLIHCVSFLSLSLSLETEDKK